MVPFQINTLYFGQILCYTVGKGGGIVYLRSCTLQTENQETAFLLGQKRTCYNGVYPYKIFPKKELETVDFAPITIFYGGNGSGKTTLLNILA